MNTETSRRSRQRGFTLTEILIATSIFAVIMIAALLIYDRSNRVFKNGVEAADLQQNTRVAFDKLVADLRMTGYDFDRDGLNSGLSSGGINQYQQPDEQIEYIANSAITIRANFDYNDNPTVDDYGREFTTTAGNSGLESPQFPVVTTGNDEIVTYALVSVDANGNPIAANNTDSITFYADVPDRKAFPGTGGRSENLVTISGVDLSNLHPPYTLMRIPVASTSAGPVSPVMIPIATGIRSMTFDYFTDQTGTVGLKDLAGTPITAANYASTVGGLGQYDPNSTAVQAGRQIRATIQSIKLTLIGMTENQDAAYTDTTDTVAPTYRKYRLETLIVPRNTGRRGLKEQDLTEPGPPNITKVCIGYCGVAFLTWDAPTTGGAPDDYQVRWDTNIGGSFTNFEAHGSTLQAFQDMPDHTLAYYFKVAAINSYGSAVSTPYPSSGAGLSVLNATTPNPPTNVTASGSTSSTVLPNVIAMQWTAPTTEGGTITCLPSGSPPDNIPQQELRGWTVRRSLDPSFDPTTCLGASTCTNALTVATPIAPDPITNLVNFNDTGVANCFNYYYRVRTTENCASQNTGGALERSAWTAAPATMGRAESDAQPSPVTDLQFVTPPSACNGTNCTVVLTWPKVTTDTSGASVTIGKYIMRRQLINSANGAVISTAPPMTIDLNTTGANFTGSSVTFSDPGDATHGSPLNDPTAAVQVYQYTITAQQCASPESSPSPARRFPCAFTATVTPTMSNAVEGGGTAGNPWLVEPTSVLSVTTSANMASITAKLYLGGVYVSDLTPNAGGTATSASWPVNDLTDGVIYTVVVSLTDLNGCNRSIAYYMEQTSTNCCLNAFSINNDIVAVDGVAKTVRVKLQNLCDELLEIQSVTIDWDKNVLASGSGGTKLNNVVYPATATVAGACPTLADVKTQSTTPVTSTPPTGTRKVMVGATPQAGLANCPDASGKEYRIDVTFNQGFLSSPIRYMCILYKRVDPSTGAYLDASNRSCKIIPAPSTTSDVCP